ncbi:DNA polymerase IV [Calderihabitans maritimus]|nr:DNA polymerase IV [Calderihabitans maritimus]
MKERKIIHVDMDAFYAAVEQRDNPALRGKPVIVGGDPRGRGVVSTASYEARRYGVRSAMPLREAYRLCPHGIFLKVNMHKYREVSAQINRIFQEYTPLVETISLDEAFLDVTGSTVIFGEAEEIGWRIKQRIKKEIGLTASVGVAGNKFLAKLASDLQKPDGFVVIRPEKVEEILHPLPVSRLWGVGKKTEEKLLSLGIKTIGDLARLPEPLLQQHFGFQGKELARLARGIDERLVEPSREAKSIGREVTFPLDIWETEVLEATLLELAESVGWRAREAGVRGRTVTLKLRYADFQTVTRSRTLNSPTALDNEIYAVGKKLFQEVYRPGQKVRLLGLTLSQLNRQKEQLSIFCAQQEREEKVARALDDIRSRFGSRAITRARLLNFRENKEKS